MDEAAKVVRENPNVSHVLTVLAEQTDEILSAVDATGGNLVFTAVQRPSDEEGLQIVKYLVETRGVCRPDAQDFNQQTALFFAARDGHVQCGRYLIEKGCNPHHTDSAGQTALFYASRDGREDVVAVLLGEFDMDVNTTDRVGQSALFYAAREGHRKIVENMLQFGANPSIRDWQKKCAHAYAQRRGHLDLAAYLKSISTETRAAEDHANGRNKRKSGPVDPRSRYLLQYSVHLPSGDIWLFAHVDKVKEFESTFPSLAAWSQISQSTILPTDSFRTDWAREALQIVHIVSNYQDGWLFTKPVDTKAWNCPDYYDVVKQPRDLTMLKRKLRGLKYVSVHTFLSDLDLMFSNCYLYNADTTYVHAAGRKVQAFCNSLLAERNFLQWVEKEEQLVSYLKANELQPILIGKEAAAALNEETSQLSSSEPVATATVSQPPNSNTSSLNTDGNDTTGNIAVATEHWKGIWEAPISAATQQHLTVTDPTVGVTALAGPAQLGPAQLGPNTAAEDAAEDAAENIAEDVGLQPPGGNAAVLNESMMEEDENVVDTVAATAMDDFDPQKADEIGLNSDATIHDDKVNVNLIDPSSLVVPTIHDKKEIS